jgi:hypothetical protein
LSEQDASKLPFLLNFVTRVLERLRDSEAEIQLASKKEDFERRTLRPRVQAVSRVISRFQFPLFMLIVSVSAGRELPNSDPSHGQIEGFYS